MYQPLNVCVCVGFVDVELELLIVIIGESSCNPSNFSNCFGSRAPGKSCLLASISTGTPCGNYGIMESHLVYRFHFFFFWILSQTYSYLVVWTFSCAHKFHFSLFHSFSIDWIEYEYDSICTSEIFLKVFSSYWNFKVNKDEWIRLSFPAC